MFSFNKSLPLRLVQITDTHLFGEPNKLLMGIDTYHSLQSVVAQVRLRPAIDLMLLSGDLSQDDSLNSYLRLQQSLAEFNCPQYWYKGNHDNQAAMEQVAAEHGYLESIIRTPHWQIILLDSQVEGSVFGYLAEDQLQLLEQALNEHPNLHTLISFHHHPIPMESAWLDRINLKNADEFLALIQRFNNVRAVLWGHVHQESDRTLNGVRFLSTPSTCVQFKPNCAEFTVDELGPGYRWLDLHADGSIDTQVERVDSQQFLPDVSINGY